MPVATLWAPTKIFTIPPVHCPHVDYRAREEDEKVLREFSEKLGRNGNGRARARGHRRRREEAADGDATPEDAKEPQDASRGGEAVAPAGVGAPAGVPPESAKVAHEGGGNLLNISSPSACLATHKMAGLDERNNEQDAALPPQALPATHGQRRTPSEGKSEGKGEGKGEGDSERVQANTLLPQR